jgi:hypothetical protein
MASTFDPPLEHLKSIDRFERALASVRAPPVGKKSDGRRLCLKRVLPKTACLPKLVKQSFRAPRLPPDRLRPPISKQKWRRRKVPRWLVRCAPHQTIGSLIPPDVCFGAGCRPGDLISAACPLPATGGPRVRIRLPPAESQSLSRIRFRRSRTQAFRAGVRGWLGERVGRDARSISISRQLAAISLSRHIPVPQCR